MTRSRSSSPAPATKARKVDTDVIKTQIEYYLSDANLSRDIFFHNKIKESEDGYLALDYIMSCKKVKELRITIEDIKEACKESTEVEFSENNIRRKDNKELPTLNNKVVKAKKTTGHEGGCLLEITGLGEEDHFGPFKGALKELLIKNYQKVFINYCSNNQNGRLVVSLTPFANDVEEINNNVKSLTVEDKEYPVALLNGDELESTLQNMPQEFRDKRKRMEIKLRREKQARVFKIGNQCFKNIDMLKRKCREIVSSRADGEELKSEGADFGLIKALLEMHPKAEEKMKNMKGLKVDVSPYGESRCFFVIREDDTFEDFSVLKIVAKINEDIPWVVQQK